MTYKLPPLSVFISEAKKQFDALQKMGLTGKISWEDHVHFVKATHYDMKKMDSIKLEEFISSRSRQRIAVLKSFQDELEKMTTASDARTRLEKAAKDAKR